MDAEIWKPVEGYDGRYEVSSLGRIRSLGIRGRILKPYPHFSPSGRLTYMSVALGKNAATKAVHRVVLEAFVGLRPMNKECAHWDGNPVNNALTNLRWATSKENCEDRERHGTATRGETHARVKLTEDDVHVIRNSTWPHCKVAPLFKISAVHVYRIRARQVWRHI